jgi:predicted DNA-binding protein
MPPTAPTSVRFPPALRERLTAAAVQERRTVSNLVRVLLEDGLAAREDTKVLTRDRNVRRR